MPIPSDDPQEYEEYEDDDQIHHNKRKSTSSSRYQARFKEISAAGGLELEDIESETDEKGEQKVKSDGTLLGGREYRLPTFTLPRHPSRQYMLTVDVAKILGFRDSYLFLLKNPKFPRLVATEEDRVALQDQNLIPSQLRNRTIAITTARSVFRHFGHKIIKKGKAVRDDYFVGDQVEAPDPPKEVSIVKETTLRGSGGSELIQSASMDFKRESVGIYNNFPYQHLDVPRDVTKVPPLIAPEGLRRDEWMYNCAFSAAEFNRSLIDGRPGRFYDPHTNIEQLPKNSQPTHVVIELENKSMNYGLVDKPVRTKRSHPDSWTVLPETEESTKYPIAIMPGQHQFSFSLYQKRFSAADVDAKPAPPPVVRPPVIEPTVSAQSIEPIEEALPKKRQRNVENICGAKTHSGGLCQRAVLRPGDRCTHHVNQIDEPDIEMKDEDNDEHSEEKEETDEHTEETNGEACAHCHHETPPDEIADKFPPDLMLTCSSCKRHHHPACIEFDNPVLVAKVQTYDWHCSNCKSCLICAKAGNDDKLLFCDTCDRGYHTFCLKPPLSSLPEGSWLCELCAVCISCKKKEDRHKNLRGLNWKHIVLPSEDKQSVGTYMCTYCENCEKHFNADRFCPLCFGVYEEDSDDIAMACCDKCDRWIHVGCDPELTEQMYEELIEDSNAAYTCILCEKRRLNQYMITNKMDPKSRKQFQYKNKLMITPALVERK